LKLFQEWGEEEIKENGRGGDFKYNISYILTVVNATIDSHPAQ
jgi:hypothetical protein